MNCKPGDLVIVVGGNRKWIGMIFMVNHIDKYFADWREHPSWTTTPEIVDPADGFVVSFFDSDLRPIRPGDLEDETPTVRELEAA